MPIYNAKGEHVGEIDLKDEIFGVEVNEDLLHKVVVMQLANRRIGTSNTLTRAEVAGGGRKPWRQKGLGRARAGSIRSPLWRHGGVTFGPKPRDFGYSMPKKARKKALKCALSFKVKNGGVLILEDLRISEPKTSQIRELLGSLKVSDKTLIVTGDWDTNVWKSGRNIRGVLTTAADSVNVYDVLRCANIIMTKDAVARVEEVLG